MAIMWSGGITHPIAAATDEVDDSTDPIGVDLVCDNAAPMLNDTDLPASSDAILDERISMVLTMFDKIHAESNPAPTIWTNVGQYA